MKKAIKLFIILALVYTIFLFKDDIKEKVFMVDELAMSFPEELNKESCIGLNYHRVLEDTTPVRISRWLLNSDELVKYSVLTTEFEEQLTSLADAGAVFLSEEELLQAKKSGNFPSKCVWVSFDDIDYSVYKNAFPILKKANVPFTMFVIAGSVGDEDFSNLKMATWDEIREMEKSGLASIGSHTYKMHRFENETPIFLVPENRAAFKSDLKKSIEVIEKELEITVRSFAYPYGDTDEFTAQALRDQGLEAGYILAPQTIAPTDDNFYINRVLVNDATYRKVILPFIKSQ